MYNQILIATDGSQHGELAVKQGLALAEALASQVIVVTVTQPYSMDGAREMGASVGSEVDDKADAFDAGKILTAVLDGARSIGISCEALHVKDPLPAKAITQTAIARDCDLIVIGPYGKNRIERFFQGSTTMEILTQSSIPVLVCR